MTNLVFESLKGVLSDEGWDVRTANAGLEGLKIFLVDQIDLVFLMCGWRGLMGSKLFKKCDKKTNVPIVIMSGHWTPKQLSKRLSWVQCSF